MFQYDPSVTTMTSSEAQMDQFDALFSKSLQLQQQQQNALARVKELANGMLASCSTTPVDEVRGLAARSSHAGTSVRGGRSSSVASAASRRGGSADCHVATQPALLATGRSNTSLDQQQQQQLWFQSVKDNLEQFGHVDVFVEHAAMDCACCLEAMNTPFRVRPKKCSHVFHIECLLQSWTEGTCPVCGVSFAPEPKLEQGMSTTNSDFNDHKEVGAKRMISSSGTTLLQRRFDALGTSNSEGHLPMGGSVASLAHGKVVAK